MDTDHTDNRFIGISCFNNTTYTKKTLFSLISGKRIDIAPLRGAWNIYFYNRKPLLLFCQEDTFSHTITVYCEANGINYHTLRWNRTSDTDPNLYKNEKLYIQWFLYLAYSVVFISCILFNQAHKTVVRTDSNRSRDTYKIYCEFLRNNR